MTLRHITLILVMLAVSTAYFAGGGEQLLNPQLYQEYFQRTPLMTAAIFCLVLVLGTATSLPVTGVLSVVAGIIFGTGPGVLLALSASSVGGTAAYLMSRYLFHDLVQQRFAVQLKVINRGIEREGAFYLFCLRMIPVIPFWLLNLLMGITPMGPGRFFLATVLGMLPVTAILANFGSELGDVASFSLRDIFTPGLILSLTLLASLPLMTRGVIFVLRRSLFSSNPAQDE